MKSVIVNGAHGKMGTPTVATIEKSKDFELVAALGHKDSLAATLEETQASIVIDLTHPSCVADNLQTIIDANAHPIIGTTGLSEQQIKDFQAQCRDKKLGGLIAPNFSIGAIMMMHCATITAKYLKHVEIIELHHEQKADAPSGTAIKTAEMIKEAQADIAPAANSHENINGVRGGLCQDIPIHSVRLPGLVAHQQVIFGDQGETFRLEHNSIDRQCFMPGILLACRAVPLQHELLYGLEKLLFTK